MHRGGGRQGLSIAGDPQSVPAVLAVGAAFAVVGLAPATNVVTGLLVGGILRWMLSTPAAWGLLASTILFAALLSVSVALCAFIACRDVLPAANRLEARLRPR